MSTTAPTTPVAHPVATLADPAAAAPAVVAPAVVAPAVVAPAVVAPAARTAFRAQASPPGFIEGGWWPRSLDLAAEAPALVRAARESGREVFRLMYSLRAWERPPRSMVVDGAVIKLGGYATVDPAVVTLVDASGWGRIDLLVVPPGTASPQAEAALAAAGADADDHAGAILARTVTEES